MEGPRRLLAHELPALGRLVDTVFMNGTEGAMNRAFSTLFNAANADNLLVYSDGDRIVSHVGRTERWASLGGCTVRVGCVGAVATDDAYRGQGLASKLLLQACVEAMAAGVDLFMISGGRGLYRRAGAAEVGRDYRATVELAAARELALEAVAIRPFEDGDLPIWMATYQQKLAHYVRPSDDWECALQSRICQTYDADFLTITNDGTPCGYIVCRVSEEDWLCHIMEYAGEARIVAAALAQVAERHDAHALRLVVQGTDPILFAYLERAKFALEPVHSSGTLLIVNLQQLVDRLRPWFAARAGLEAAERLDVLRDGDRFVFTCGDASVELENLAAATEFLFGHHERNRPSGVFAKMFPAPTLRYGLSFI